MGKAVMSTWQFALFQQRYGVLKNTLLTKNRREKSQKREGADKRRGAVSQKRKREMKRWKYNPRKPQQVRSNTADNPQTATRKALKKKKKKNHAHREI